MRKTCLEMVHELARQDERVVFIGSDLGVGTLDAMREEMPDRFFMEGVSEQNLIGMAAGLALEGFVPYVNTIATFITRRCYEQVAVDLCLHDLPVRLIGNGGGLVYAPLGPTHLAIEDIAILRALPGMGIVAPCDAEEMRRFMRRSLEIAGPCYIRLAKGGDAVVSDDARGFAFGEAIVMREPGDLLLIGTGISTTRALAAADELAGDGIAAGVLHVHTVKPLDEPRILELAQQVETVLVVEEHSLIGGLASAVGDLLHRLPRGALPRFSALGIPDHFPDRYGSQDELLAHYGLDGHGIAAAVRRLVEAGAAEAA